MLNDTYLPMFFSITKYFFNKWGLDKHPTLFSDLLCGEEKLKSVEIVYNAISLAEYARKNDSLKSFLKNNDPKDCWHKLSQIAEYKNFYQMLVIHLDKFGDRGLEELKLEKPNLRDTPWVLIQIIINYLDQDISVEKIKKNEMERRLTAEKILKKETRFLLHRRLVLLYLLRNLRRLIRNRENSRYSRSELFGFTKNIFTGIAKQFVKNGTLTATSDIYFLSMEEIFGYIEGHGINEGFIDLVETRKKQLQKYKEKESPINITTY
ncbi:MAG: hypothetical protein HQK51_20445, partial [Oligoflexia bacterium]|nr:hypothetical protein [Oligoflexia bacterium]